MSDEEHLLSIPETAARLGLSPLTVADRLRAGTLPGFKFGRLWRVRAADLDEYVRELATAGAEGQAARRAKRQAAKPPPGKPGRPRKPKPNEGGTP